MNFRVRLERLRHQATPILADIVQSLNSLLPSTLRSSHEVLVVEGDSVHRPEDTSHVQHDVGNVTIDVLPDDVEEDSVHLPEDSNQGQDPCMSFVQCPQQPPTDPTGNVGNATIDVLPDDALVEIFSFYVNVQTSESGWSRLIQVTCMLSPQTASAAASSVRRIPSLDRDPGLLVGLALSCITTLLQSGNQKFKQ